MIDLVRTYAPPTLELQAGLKRALLELAVDESLGESVRTHGEHGRLQDRVCAGAWLSTRLGRKAPPEEVLLTSGVQSTLSILFSAFRREGRTVISEALSYTPVPNICKWLSIPHRGVAIDAEGLVPQALEDVCRAAGPALLYCNPTLHNPTTATMSSPRRTEIAEIARKYDLVIVEDDVHGLLWADAPAPIARLAPERSWYIMTLSKCLGFGLREAILVGPSATALEHLKAIVPSYSGWHVPSLSAALVTNLIANGDAALITTAVSAEIAARHVIAREQLEAVPDMRTDPHAMHLWIELRSPAQADRIVSKAADMRVILRPWSFYADASANSPLGIRISITATRDRQGLAEGLSAVASILSDEGAFIRGRGDTPSRHTG